MTPSRVADYTHPRCPAYAFDDSLAIPLSAVPAVPAAGADAAPAATKPKPSPTPTFLENAG